MNNSKDEIDPLRHIELLTEKINEMVNKKGRSAFARYPITFALLALFGIITLSEGAKEILRSIGILSDNPWYSILIGLIILIFTGTLYKKLDK